MRRVHRLTLTGLALLGALAFGVAPALAGTGHGFTGLSFGSEGSAAGQFKEPAGVAVNDATTGPNAGDVYVVDKGNNRIDEFEADGTFIRAWGWGVAGGLGFESCGPDSVPQVLTCQTGSPGSGAGQLEGAEAIAIDNDASSPSKGDVYVTDVGHDAVEKFGATGAYLGQITTGSGGAAFSGLLGVAVDSKGMLWVYEGNPNARNGEIVSYSDAQPNKFEASFPTSPSGRFAALGFAVAYTGTEDNFYVGQRERRTVAKLNGTGEEVINEEVGGSGSTAVAVDPSSGDVYINVGTVVEVSDPAVEPVETFGSKHPVSGIGLAVSPVTGDVYVADATGDEVDVFTEGPTPEPPLTEEAEEITATTAVLHGELNPNVEAEAGWYFAYNLGASCTGGKTTSEEAEADVKEVKEHQEITELEPSAQYTFCFVAKSEFGPTLGPPKTFTTAGVPPEAIVGGGSVSAATSIAATLTAQVNPDNEETHAYLQYSTSATVNLSGPEKGALQTPTKTATPPGALVGSNFEDRLVGSATVTGLTAGTTYYYQVVATNAAGTTYGPVETFATVPDPFTDSPTLIGTTTATFNGHFTLNENVATQYAFDYNLGPVCTIPKVTREVLQRTEKLGLPVPVQPSTPTEEDPATVTGLQPNAEYTVCFVTSNRFSLFSVEIPIPGTIDFESVIATVPQLGTPVPFKTEPAPPSVLSESAAAISSATGPTEGVGAQVDPNNEATSYTFEYSTEGKAGAGEEELKGTIRDVNSTVPLEGFNEAGETAFAHIENLEAGRTYYYRVVANNAQSKAENKPVVGEVEQFTASVVPAVTTGAAQDPARTAIVLDGTVNPNGVATTYRFEYIEQAAYEAALAGDAEEKTNPYANGASTTPQRACPAAELAVSPTTCDDEGTAAIEVEELIKAGLLPETTYHYALVASTNTGSITGEGKTFTTAPSTPPLVTTGGASEVTLSTATISGSVGTEGLDVRYAFEVSTNPAEPGPPSGGGSIGAGTTEEAVSLALQGLQPGTTYYYKLVATSTDGTVEGTLGSFTTPGFPSQLVLPATPGLIAYTSPAFPKETGNTGAGAETKTLTRAQKLAAALKQCHKKHGAKRTKCERAAHKHYGVSKKRKG